MEQPGHVPNGPSLRVDRHRTGRRKGRMLAPSNCTGAAVTGVPIPAPPLPRPVNLAVLVAVAIGAVGILLADPVHRVLAFGLMPALAGGAIFIGVERFHPVQARAWRWLGMGLGLVGFGHVLGLVPPFVPGILQGTVPAVAGYVCLIVGALLFSRSAGLKDDIAIIDAGIIALGLVLILWDLLIEPFAGTNADARPAMKFLAVAFPVADILIVAILLPVVIEDPARRLGSGALALAFGLFALADGQAGSDVIRGVREPGRGLRNCRVRRKRPARRGRPQPPPDRRRR